MNNNLEQELEAIIQHGVRSGSVIFRPYSILKLPVLHTVLIIGGKVSPCIRVIEIKNLSNTKTKLLM